MNQYLEALDQMGPRRSQPRRKRKPPGESAGLQISQEMLPGQLLLPNDRSNWNTLTNVTGWSASLMPEQPTAQEKDLYFKLRDDKNVRDVTAYELIANARSNNPYQSHSVFVQGEMARDRMGNEAGMIHDPAQFRDALHFAQTVYSDWDYIKVERLYRTLESDCYESLGLGELIDANTGNYQKPILQLFDQLNQETKPSAIFRAFVTFKLLAVAKQRPGEWGFHGARPPPPIFRRSPAWAPKKSRAVTGWCRSGLTNLKGRCRSTLRGPALSRWKSRRGSCSNWRATPVAKGFSCAGYVDASGHPVLQAPASPSGEYCGWSSSGSAAVLLRKAAGGETFTPLAEPLPYTPLFAFPVGRRELLLQTLDATGYPAALAGPILPPFFIGVLHE